MAELPAVIEFVCPSCFRQCRVSPRQKAVQHADPTCPLWHDHKGGKNGGMQEFLKLALLSARAPQIQLGDVQIEADEIIEQVIEGFRKLGVKPA